MLVRCAGLGLLAGAVLQSPLSAQVAPRDTTRRQPDSVQVVVPANPSPALPDTVLGDTAATARPRRTRADTIQPPLMRGHLPTAVAIGEPFRWDRDSIFASGAVTLLDLLEQVPGVTGYRARWIASPSAVAYLGDVGRLRIFYDGVELDPLDPRAGGILDPADLPLWTLEEVVIEPGPGELRVHARSWRVERTTPVTRVHVFTGDEDTNLYRAFYGKRFGNGAALQLAAQQFNSEADRFAFGGDQLAMMGRIGWVRGRLGVDAVAIRTGVSRSAQLNLLGRPSIPALEAHRNDAYLRVGYGNPDADGGWVQMLAASSGYREHSPVREPESLLPADSADTARSRAQYVAAAGWKRGPWGVTATERLRVFRGETHSTPAARLVYEGKAVHLAVLAEGDAPESPRRLEAAARVSLFRWLAASGTVGAYRQARAVDTAAALYGRGEAAVRLGRLWTGAGLMFRDLARVPPPIVFDPAYSPVEMGRDAGAFVSLRGPLYKALGMDAHAVAWNPTTRDMYRPRYQSRSEIWLRTRWLERFPSGNFGVSAAARHEYRSRAIFPTVEGQLLTAPQSQIVSTLLEVRIVSAVLSWQFRNVLGRLYETVPGFEAPRQLNVYGVRWEFWN